MTRQCARPDCADHATSTFGSDYRESTVWLVDLTEEPHPSTYDMCRRHANALSVPVGWQLRDRRDFVPRIIGPDLMSEAS
jgi:hypothetical protein